MDIESYSIIVIGGTPGGIAAAVRAAREGCDTLLVTYNNHLGGMMAGGLSYTDTLTKKDRAPILSEFFERVRSHYLDTYGEDSSQYEFSEDGHVFEPHVAEETFDTLVENEDELDVLWRYQPVSAERANRSLQSITMESFDGTETRRVSADVFLEATYEGDMMAVAGVPYRVGRESRSEYDEQFAGRLFTGVRGDRFYPRAAVGSGDDSAPADRRGPLDVADEKRTGELDLIPHPAGLTEIYPESTGVGDDAIQAYNYRLCLSRDPENRRLPDKPDSYDRSEFLEILDDVVEAGLRSFLLLRYLPNDKADMNSADLPGENHDYPEADWSRRDEIATRHRDYALGLLYFLQNDDAVPDEIREEARKWGLATDEFTDNDNFPWQFYIREARRLDGRYVFSENDARHAPDLGRTPIHNDAIAIAEYPLDSHACWEERQQGSQPEGFFYASQVTRPSQVPYHSLLPKGLDNLVVPIPLSATHVAYGTIRLEPTWMHIGESAGFAAALAIETDTLPSELDIQHLQHRLVESGVMCTFFNEFAMGDDEDWVPAVQLLGTMDFFNSYNARPHEPLEAATADAWIQRLENQTDLASDLPDDSTSTPLTEAEFTEKIEQEVDDVDMDPLVNTLSDTPSDTDFITRGMACNITYDILIRALME